MAIVGGPPLLTRAAKGLAREAANEAIHDAAPRAAVEGSQIRPNRRIIQPPFFHARRQDFAAVGFVFNAADDASSRDRHSDAEVESAAAGADADGM